MSDKIITDFVIEEEKHYGGMFFMEEFPLTNGKKKVLLMTEKLALDLKKKIDRKTNIIVSSLETDESIGDYYHVGKNKIVFLYNHPRDNETERLTKDLKPEMIRNENGKKTVINELVSDELLRGFKSKKNPGWLAVVIYHDFDSLAPKALGWVKNLDDLEKLSEKIFTRPEKLKSLEESIYEVLGLPYLIGGRSKKTGYDCSSLVQKIIYDTTGVWLPRKASWQAMVGEKILSENIQMGDLVFFEEKPDWKVKHVGIVFRLQDDQNIIVAHASRYEGKIVVDNVKDKLWFKENFRISEYRRIKKYD